MFICSPCVASEQASDVVLTPAGFVEICIVEDIDTIKRFLPGVLPMLTPEDKFNAMRYSIHSIEVFRLFLESGFPTSLNHDTKESEWSMIHCLIRDNPRKATQLLALLIEYGADVREVSKEFKQSPLASAITLDMPTSFIDLLISTGAPMNDPSIQEGYSPAIIAIRLNKHEFLRRFLDMGLDPNGSGKMSGDLFPFIFAASMYSDVETVRMLLDHGSDATMMHPAGGDEGEIDLPVIIAGVIGGREDVVRLLCSRGADPNWRDLYGNSIAMYAADIAMETKHEKTQSRNEVKFNITETMRTIAELAPDTIRAVNLDGETPLHVAMKYNKKIDFPTLKLFLDLGVDPDIRDINDKRAIDYFDKNSALGKNTTFDIVSSLFERYSKGDKYMKQAIHPKGTGRKKSIFVDDEEDDKTGAVSSDR